MEHEHAHADPHDPFQKKVALSMSIFAVLLAFVTMLTNQARTEALLLSNKAADQWAYYQSKSVKGASMRAEADLLDALTPTADEKPSPDHVKRISDSHASFLKEADRYDDEKEKIQEDAEELEADAKANEAKEGQYEYASVAIELGIVVATVALLLASKPAFYISLVLAFGGVGWSGKTATISVMRQHAEGRRHGEKVAPQNTGEKKQPEAGKPSANAAEPGK